MEASNVLQNQTRTWENNNNDQKRQQQQNKQKRLKRKTNIVWWNLGLIKLQGTWKDILDFFPNTIENEKKKSHLLSIKLMKFFFQIFEINNAPLNIFYTAFGRLVSICQLSHLFLES